MLLEAAAAGLPLIASPFGWRDRGSGPRRRQRVRRRSHGHGGDGSRDRAPGGRTRAASADGTQLLRAHARAHPGGKRDRLLGGRRGGARGRREPGKWRAGSHECGSRASRAAIRRITHTFILREVRALRRLGVEVRCFSIWRTAEADLLSELDREEWRDDRCAAALGAARLARAHLSAFRHGPRAVCGDARARARAFVPRCAAASARCHVVRRGDDALGRMPAAGDPPHPCAAAGHSADGGAARGRVR